MTAARGRRVSILGLVVAATLAVATTGAAGAADNGDFDFVDLTDFPIVRLVISPPPSLAPDDVARLRVLEDGTEREAQVFPLRSEPIELVLLLDTSGSMAGAPIEAAKAAAIEFVSSLPADSDISVLGFGDEVSIVAGLGASREELIAAIGGIDAQGETALYDAVVAAAAAVRVTDRTRQFIVVLSDGGDTVSAATIGDVTTALAAEPVGFYAIELAGSERDPEALGLMAQASRGRVIPASDITALASVYAEIASLVVSQYAVVFESASGGPTVVDVILGPPSSETRFSRRLEFPEIGGETITPVATIAPPEERTLTPPSTSPIRGPNRLSGDWAMTTGIALVGLTLLVLFAFALWPSTEKAPNPLLTDSSRPATLPRRGRGGLRLNELASKVGTGAGRFIGGRQRRGIEAALDAAGVTITAGEYLAMVAIAALGGLAIGLIGDSLPLGLLLGLGAIAVPRMLLSRAAEKRRAAFADQLEGTLQLIAGSLRAGYGLSQAVATVATEAPVPTADEFGRIVIETRVGRDLATSMNATAERMRSDDFAWVSAAISIQQEVGGNLAEVLDAVASTIRDRNQIRRQIHTLSAEGRISAVILIALPFTAAGGISVVNPGYLNPLLASTGGKVAVAVGIVLMVLGIIWIRRITKIAF